MAARLGLTGGLFCQNNFYGMSTPQRDYTRLENIADRAKAYGIPGVTVDGNDALAVAQVSIEAIQRPERVMAPHLSKPKHIDITAITWVTRAPATGPKKKSRKR